MSTLLPRLSVIVTSMSRVWLPHPQNLPRKAEIERAIQSVLSQTSTSSAEVVFVDASIDRRFSDALETTFREPVLQGNLHLVDAPIGSSLSTARNLGVEQARGHFLSFLDPTDVWAPGRLQRVEALMSGHDLLLFSRESLALHTDLVQWILKAHQLVPSSAVIRRSLFEQAGGFPTRRLTQSEYEFWIRCLLLLSDKRSRISLQTQSHISPTPVRHKIELPVETARSALTTLRFLPKVATRYWPTIARRLLKP